MDLYFNDYRLSIETDENGDRGRNIDYEITRIKAIEQELGCDFIIINPNKEKFVIFETINEIFRHVKQ